MLKGVVKWFNNEKGFGFIRCDNKDYFVHFSEIQSDGYKILNDGDNVTFESSLGERGLAAKNVKIDSGNQ